MLVTAEEIVRRILQSSVHKVYARKYERKLQQETFTSQCRTHMRSRTRKKSNKITIDLIQCPKQMLDHEKDKERQKI